jgi:hypothetical protein
VVHQQQRCSSYNGGRRRKLVHVARMNASTHARMAIRVVDYPTQPQPPSRPSRPRPPSPVPPEMAGNFIGGRDMMMQVWNDATKTKYNFLMINMANESNVRIFQIGSEGFNEYEGVGSSLQPNNHTTSTPVVDKRSPSELRLRNQQQKNRI